MLKSRMKQRVAVSLAWTVWLASIVGASVPSGETTAFTTHNPPGPSSDQYTPLLRSPRYYSQDDYGQEWMNDEPSRIKVAGNRQENTRQAVITDSDISLPHESSSLKDFKDDEELPMPYIFQSNKVKSLIDLDKEALRLSSMKVAFDEPIDSEISETSSSSSSSEEDWLTMGDEGLEEDDVMQQDQFVADGNFEDEGPGSVEVYKLDLYNDGSILQSPKPLSKKSWTKAKSKIPKKVEAQFDQKSKDPEEPKPRPPKTAPRPEPSRSLKDRIFGSGGVPELQVGCEGVEEPRRRKRSEPEEPTAKKSGATPLYIDAEYEEDEDEDEDRIGGTDELFRILSQATTTTGSPLVKENRGDMDPRVKTPGDLDKPRKKDKLPIRGDLGPSGDQNLGDGSGAIGSQSEVGNGRRLLSVNEEEEELEEVEKLNVRTKRNSDEGYAGTKNAINKGKKKRSHRHHKGGKKWKHHGGKLENKTKKRSAAIDKWGEEQPEDDMKENRLFLEGKVSNLPKDHQPASGIKNGWNWGREKRHKQLLMSNKDRKTAEENEKKLAYYMKRNTPIPRKQGLGGDQYRKTKPGIEPPLNIRLPVGSPVYGNEAIDKYAENRRLLLQEQRQTPVGHINRAAYELELKKQSKEMSPKLQSTERPYEQRQGKSVYKPRSQAEIDRLNALPVSAYIMINQPKIDNVVPEIGGRFGGDEIAFPGLTPGNDGRKVSNFPSPPTTSPPVAGPSPCTWAVMTCCSNQNRLATCFEAKGCHQGHWDDPCSNDKMIAALQMVKKYYGGQRK